MKAKNIIYIIIFCLFGYYGCEEFLEEDLRDQITTDNFFNNDNEAILAANGLYRILKRGSLYNTRGLDNFLVNGADLVGPSRNVNANIHNYLIDEGVADGRGTWDSFYELIRNANNILDNLEDNSNISEPILNQVRGEALFIRGLAYFHLTNLWGDVPYFRQLLPATELAVLERFSKDIIRDDMKADLQEAFEILPSFYGDAELGRATKWAAMTLKAKYHLFDEEWSETVTSCNEVINNSPHILLPNFADVFDQSDLTEQFNDELIFVIDFTTDGIFGGSSTQRTDDYNPRLRDEPVNRNVRPGGPGTPANFELLRDALDAQDEGMTGFGWAIPLPEFADQDNWQSGDLRYEATIVQEYLGFQLNFPYFRKNWNLSNSSPRQNHNENYYVFRLADVYLMAAEAENELNGPNNNAYQYVNAVRERAFEPDQPWSGMSQEGFRQGIRDERKFELAAEGHRRMDLIRWGILLDVVSTVQHRPWNNPAANIQPKHVLLPIPQGEIILNPNLLNTDETNNGYR